MLRRNSFSLKSRKDKITFEKIHAKIRGLMANAKIHNRLGKAVGGANPCLGTRLRLDRLTVVGCWLFQGFIMKIPFPVPLSG